MYRRPSKKKEIITRIVIYIGMTILVLVGVTGLILFILGYQIDTQNGHVEQGALLQLDSNPTGATVQVDGRTLSGKTPTKSSVLAGTHTFTMTKSGYEVWTKTIDIKAGTLSWLDYARLVPTNRSVSSVATYDKLYNSLASVGGRSLLIQPEQAVPSFQLVDLGGDTISQSTLVLPAQFYSQATTPGVVHSFHLNQWDTGGRYVLIEHTYGDKKEWIELDTKDVTASKNISLLLDINISDAWLSGTNGATVFVLNGNDIRKLDLSAATISRSLVSRVTSFTLFDANVITYIGTDATDPTKRVVGLYRDGDSAPHILRTTTSTADVSLHVATSRYFNEDYVAISEGSKVDVLNGSYPSSASDDSKSLALYSSFESPVAVDRLTFSPKGYYILAQNGAQFAGYDIEHKTMSTSSISTVSTAVRPLQWLDDSYIWSDTDGVVTMREFDGSNSYKINPALYGQDVTLSKDGRYMYSIGKTPTGYQLQRIKMILN